MTERVGFSVYHSKTKYRRLRNCCEMAEITDAVYSARELAMSRMQAQATKLHASGIVDVSIDMKFASGPTLTFTALGTAIATPKSRPDDSGPRMGVDLTERRCGRTA